LNKKNRRPFWSGGSKTNYRLPVNLCAQTHSGDVCAVVFVEAATRRIATVTTSDMRLRDVEPASPLGRRPFERGSEIGARLGPLALEDRADVRHAAREQALDLVHAHPLAELVVLEL
jgi:hypothetical protein